MTGKALSSMPKKTELDHADPFEAFRTLVYQAGADQLAPLMGMKRGTLYNKADSDEASHNQPTLRDVVLVTQLTGDLRVIDALNERFGRAVFDLRSQQAASDAALLELIAALGAENGDFHRAVHEALVEHRFTAEGMTRIRAEAFDVAGALMTLVHRLEGLVDEH